MISIQDILQYKKDQEHLEGWNFDKPLFIEGNSGVGKSTLSKCVFNNKNITTNIIDSNYIKKGKGTINYIEDILGKTSITAMFSSRTLNGLIIDDLEVIDSQDNIISKLFLIIKKNNNKVSPIIIVCNSMFLSSNVKKIKKLCYTISIPTPSLNRMVKSCNLLLPDSVILKCANKSEGDWSYFNRLLSISKVDDKLTDTASKQVSYNITTLLDVLLKKEQSLNDIFIKCSADHGLLSLLCFTNIPKILKKRNLSCGKAYSSLQYFDIVEKVVDSEWSYIDISILLGCVIPLREVTRLDLKDFEVSYTHVFSVSTSQINHRKLLKKINQQTGKSVNILGALLYHSLKNDIAYKKCKTLNLREFTLNELQKTVNCYYKPHNFTTGQKKILLSLIAS
jgi:hypothetical protein